MSNATRHFYLYAKGHYLISEDPIEDLKHIVADYSGVEPWRVHKSDIYTVLVDIVKAHTSFEKFMMDFLQDLKLRHVGVSALDAESALILQMVKILRFVRAKDIGFDLGEADGTILDIPIREGSSYA